MKHCPFVVVWERGAHFDICLVFVWVQPTLSYFTTVPVFHFSAQMARAGNHARFVSLTLGPSFFAQNLHLLAGAVVHNLGDNPPALGVEEHLGKR